MQHTAMSTDEFRHERLKLSGSFMRLIQIQGGTKKDVISLRITQYAIHRRPAYAAISYTWGSIAAEMRQIRVNGRPFRVRVNLWHLLYHLRQRGESRFLWIDALCIDQQNLEERNFHVQLMGKIYETSALTIVWLGLPSDDRRQARALEFVSEMAASTRRKQPHSQQKQSSPSSKSTFAETYLVEKYAARWTTLLELCRGNYWTRTWIIQEFVQASSVEVLCGTASLDWKDFEDVVRAVREITTATASSSPRMPAFVPQFAQTIPFRLTSRRLSHTASTLEELLSEFYDSKCAERRDKIYGVLGIADDCGLGGGEDVGDDDDSNHPEKPPGLVAHLGPQPDYSKHIIEVYFEVFKYLHPSQVRPKLSLQAVVLAQRALGITADDVVNYFNAQAVAVPDRIRPRNENNDTGNDDGNTPVATPSPQLPPELNCSLVPDYVNTIDEVLPGWTSIRDLRQRLEQVDWAKYVGHKVVVKRKTGASASGGNSSNQGGSQQTEYIRAPLPTDMLDNVIRVASSHSDSDGDEDLALARLWNYPVTADDMDGGATIPPFHILLHDEDKRLFSSSASSTSNNHNNPTISVHTITKPSVIIESNLTRGIDPVRVGFACSDVRSGDLLCQFAGVDVTLVARRVHGGLKLVGTARMVTHNGLREVGVHPGCVSAGRKRSTGGTDSSRSSSSDGEKMRRRLWSGIVLGPAVKANANATAKAEGHGEGGSNLLRDTADAKDKGVAIAMAMAEGNEDGWEMKTDPLSLWEILRPS